MNCVQMNSFKGIFDVISSDSLASIKGEKFSWFFFILAENW